MTTLTLTVTQDDDGYEALCPELQLDASGETAAAALLMMADQLFAMSADDYAEPLPFVLKPTPRGFERADFLDANNEACSIQESSVATEPMLWLGQNRGTTTKEHQPETQCLARMHLTRAHVVALLPLLHRFAATGSLSNGAEVRKRAVCDGCGTPAVATLGPFRACGACYAQVGAIIRGEQIHETIAEIISNPALIGIQVCSPCQRGDHSKHGGTTSGSMCGVTIEKNCLCTEVQ